VQHAQLKEAPRSIACVRFGAVPRDDARQNHCAEVLGSVTAIRPSKLNPQRCRPHPPAHLRGLSL
jgi:hypothetical protein